MDIQKLAGALTTIAGAFWKHTRALLRPTQAFVGLGLFSEIELFQKGAGFFSWLTGPNWVLLELRPL